MRLSLDPLLSVARVRDDLVVLDLAKGTYEVAPAAFCGVACEAQAQSRLDDLLAARPAPALEPLWHPTALHVRRALTGLDPPRVDITLRDRWDFARAWLGVVLSYPGRPLRRLLARRAPIDCVATAETLRRAAVFDRLLPWAPFPGACLWRAYFLRLFLRRGGCEASWVFGVRTWPFRAHCWLEAGGVVLNDDPRAVWPYTPILRA